MEHESRGVHVSAGDGIVAHVRNLTAYASGDENRLNELLVHLNALAGAPWQEIVRTLTAGIAEAGYDDHPHLACVSVEEDKVAALVFGDMALSITIDGSETILDGRDSSTWIDVALHGKVDRVHAGEQSDSAVVGVIRDGVIPAGGFLLDTSGPMPASGRWSEIMSVPAALPEEEALPVRKPLHQVEELAAEVPPVAEVEAENVEPQVAEDIATPAETAPAETVPAPTESSSDEHTDLDPVAETQGAPAARSMFARIEEIGRPDASADGDEFAPPSSPRLFGTSPFHQNPPTNESDASSVGSTSADLQSAPAATATLAPERPQLRGVTCMAGHLTAPNETSCRTCGEPVAADAEPATGDRPILGTITFDDGAVLNIDRPAAIGSDVPTGYSIGDEPATVVRLDDGVGGVSDVQVEVRLSGWNVEIIDMQSENGTYTMLLGERHTRTKLRAGQSVVLQPGMTIETGGRSFVYTVGPAPATE